MQSGLDRSSQIFYGSITQIDRGFVDLKYIR